MMEIYIEKFVKAIHQSTGAAPSLEEIVPGKWVTFPVTGMRGDTKGRCKLFLDGKSGLYVHWDENGINMHTWQAGEPHTQERHAAFQAQVKEAKKEFVKIEAEQRAVCRQKSVALWEKGQAVDAGHPYIVAKGISPYGVRQLNERLMIPVRDAGGTLHGLQFIAPNGSSQFKAGTVVTGCYHIIGVPNGKLLVTDAWESACTLHQATGLAVVVAFNSGNLKAVAEALRAVFPDAQIVVSANDDGNQGIAKAGEAARAVNGFLAVPTFLGNKEAKVADFNALALLAGLEAVKACIEAAAIPTLCHAPEAESEAASSQIRVVDAAGSIVLELPPGSVLIIHHSGKDGAQRGISRRDGLLGTVIALQRPGGNTVAKKGCYEAQDVIRADGRQRQTMRAQENSTAKRVAALLNGGIPQKEIAELLGITKGAVSKAKKKAVRLGLLNTAFARKPTRKP